MEGDTGPRGWRNSRQGQLNNEKISITLTFSKTGEEIIVPFLTIKSPLFRIKLDGAGNPIMPEWAKSMWCQIPRAVLFKLSNRIESLPTLIYNGEIYHMDDHRPPTGHQEGQQQRSCFSGHNTFSVTNNGLTFPSMSDLSTWQMYVFLQQLQLATKGAV